MKLSLSILDRLAIKGIFPEKSNLQEQIISMDIEKKVFLTQEQMKNISLKIDEKGLCTWNQNSEGAKEKEIELTVDEISFLNRMVDRLDKEEGITRQTAGLCKKIKEV